MKVFFAVLKRLWMKFAHAAGWVNTRVILTLAYLLIIGSAGLIMRLISGDLLDRRTHRKDGDSYWKPKPPADASLEASRRQF